MKRSRILLIAGVLFFSSGALGLGYELVWIRKAALVVGASQIALSTVLTSFFLGLGLGSYFVGRYLRSTRWSPLVIYGLFEVAVGVFALSFPALFDLLEATYGALYPSAAGSGFLLFSLRFTLLFVLFLPPTFFMGGTLPLLLDALVEQDHTIGSRTSVLYGINILGAVAGVLLTCYFAIPELGVNTTSMVGGCGNIALGLVAIVLFRAVRPLHAGAKTARAGRSFVVLALFSGLVAIAYQVIWARYFSLFHTTTVYLTAVLLGVFLLALAVGSLLLAPLLHARRNPLRIVGFLHALVPLCALWGLELWRLADYVPSVLAGVRRPDGSIERYETLEINHDDPGFWHFFSEPADATFFAPLFQIALVIFIPVMLMGATLPGLITAATRRASGLRSVSGTLVLSNTLGSSAGGFAAGYVFLPLLGLHWTFLVLALGSVVIAVSCHRLARSLDVASRTISRAERRRSERSGQHGARRIPWAGYSVAALSLAGSLMFLLVLRDDITHRTIRRFGYGRDPGAQQLPLVEVLEGPLTTSFVFENEASLQVGSGHVALAVAYKEAPSTQAIQGHVPVLYYPGRGMPADCLGICLGSGQSFGALLLYDAVRRLDVVDISSEIKDLCDRYFGPYNHQLSQDPRVRFHLDDGRHFVARALRSSYDVISMEPPPPTADGVFSLYSKEFYEECRRVLRPGGVFMQWLPLYRVTPLDTVSIIKTQASIFPYSFIVKVGQDDFMVVSYPERPVFDIESIGKRCQVFAAERLVDGERWSSRSEHDVASLEAVLGLLVMGPEDIEAMPGGSIYDDDTQRLSYTSGDRGLLRLYRGPFLSRISFTALDLTAFETLAEYFDPRLPKNLVETASRERAASLAFFGVPDPQQLDSLERAYESSREPEKRAVYALQLAELYDGMLRKREAFRWLEAVLADHPDMDDPQSLKIARDILHNHLAVFEAPSAQWVARVVESYRNAPMTRVLERELAAFQRRAEAGRSKWLFPRVPDRSMVREDERARRSDKAATRYPGLPPGPGRPVIQVMAGRRSPVQDIAALWSIPVKGLAPRAQEAAPPGLSGATTRRRADLDRRKALRLRARQPGDRPFLHPVWQGVFDRGAQAASDPDPAGPRGPYRPATAHRQGPQR